MLTLSVYSSMAAVAALTQCWGDKWLGVKPRAEIDTKGRRCEYDHRATKPKEGDKPIYSMHARLECSVEGRSVALCLHGYCYGHNTRSRQMDCHYKGRSVVRCNGRAIAASND